MAKKKRVNWVNIVLIALILLSLSAITYYYLTREVSIIGADRELIPPVMPDVIFIKGTNANMACPQGYDASGSFQPNINFAGSKGKTWDLQEIASNEWMRLCSKESKAVLVAYKTSTAVTGGNDAWTAEFVCPFGYSQKGWFIVGPCSSKANCPAIAYAQVLAYKTPIKAASIELKGVESVQLCVRDGTDAATLVVKSSSCTSTIEDCTAGMAHGGRLQTPEECSTNYLSQVKSGISNYETRNAIVKLCSITAPPSSCAPGMSNITRATGCYQSYYNEQQCPSVWSQPGVDCSANDYPSFLSTNADSACCSNQNSCVYNGQCYPNLNFTKLNGEEVICISGKWIERDSTSKTCTGTSGCSNIQSEPSWASSYEWISAGFSNIGEYDSANVTECCGDDANEYVKTSGSIKLCCNSPSSVIENGVCKNSMACSLNSSCSGTTPFCDLSTNTCVGCLSNFDCDIGYGCKDKTCKICEITDAKWSQSTSYENARINLTGKSNCGEGEEIFFVLHKKNSTGTFRIDDVDIDDTEIETEERYNLSWKIEVPEEDKTSFKYFYSAIYKFNSSLNISADSTYLTIESACTENWNCTAWSTCINNKQTRTCTDRNNCSTLISKPATNQSCTPEADCSNGKKDGDETGIDCGGNCITQSFEIECADGIDNDNNCKIDCADSNCFMDPVCSKPVCGNGICDSNENSANCPDDCEADSDGDGLSDNYELKQGLDVSNPDTDRDGINDKQDQWPLCDLATCESPYGVKRCPANCVPETPGIFDSLWIWILAIVGIASIIGIILYIYLFAKPKKGLAAKSLFINKKDEVSITLYVKKQIEKKVPEINIRKLLLSKKWKNEQIDYAFKEATKSQPQQKPVQKTIQKK